MVVLGGSRQGQCGGSIQGVGWWTSVVAPGVHIRG